MNCEDGIIINTKSIQRKSEVTAKYKYFYRKINFSFEYQKVDRKTGFVQFK